MKETSKLSAATLLLSLWFATIAHADPCGMVPPVTTGQQNPITRVGEQKTFVFYKDGVETFVIRPGFAGKTDEFGMLIPFPNPPELRKLPDHIFPHIAAAIDPPEVVVNLRWHRGFMSDEARKGAGASESDAGGQQLMLNRNKVRVLKEEAVGMYEIAVLAAGSAQALSKWMDKHGYRYPKGMDVVCEEYVQDKWCFVAVKTKVGDKGAADPKPAQRNVDAALPQGATFDGHVQAMGFRFRTDKLVVPMRLSAFNEGELRNIVYLLTDKPQRIRSIPEEYVVRQISGVKLHRNITDPLPLRIIGGTEKDIPEDQRKSLPQQRDPKPHNGAAKELFAGDLLAVATGQLSLHHEEKEKDLLAIGERLGLRGPDIDKLHHETLTETRDKATAGALSDLAPMTLTVVDGDFPREVLARKNLTFGQYKMPSRRNSQEGYDAKANGPTEAKQGKLYFGAIDWDTVQASQIATSQQETQLQEGHMRLLAASLFSALGIAVVLAGALWRNRCRE